MAYANWLNPSKTSGSGNDTVSVGALTDNTGRNSRSTNMTFKAANVADVVRQVIQAGKPEFVNIQSAAAVSTPKCDTLLVGYVATDTTDIDIIRTTEVKRHRVGEF